MKHIYKFGDKGYVQMDSYFENHGTQLSDVIANILMTSLVLSIAAITGAAMVGVDITNTQPSPIHQSK